MIFPFKAELILGFSFSMDLVNIANSYPVKQVWVDYVVIKRYASLGEEWVDYVKSLRDM